MRHLVRVSRAKVKRPRALYLILGLIGALSFAYAAQGAVERNHTRTVSRFCGSIDLRPGKTFLDISASNKFSHRFCIVGKRGAKGARGLPGAPGAAGAQGVPGAAGAPGARGPQGERGLPGNGIAFIEETEVCAYGGWLISYLQVFEPTAVCNGAPGPQGPQGETGATGPQGPQGEQGPAGADGVDGLDGQDGAPGVDGAPGADGQDGADGATGPAGPTGPQGPQGPQGPAGADGRDGATGPQGAAGPTGPQGPQGPAGLDGSTIVTVTANGVSGQKTTVALCPAAHPFAISGGFAAQGSVTESYRNADGHGWTVTQSSGNTDSLQVFAYCA